MRTARTNDRVTGARTAVFLVAALLLGVVPTARAGNIGVGLGLDLARTNLSGQPPDEGKYVAKFGPGVFAELDFEVATDVQVSFQPGWVQGGASLEFETAPEFDREISIDYVELPVLVRVFTEADRRVRPYALAGLAVGLPVNAEIESSDGTEDILDELETADLRAKFGLGLRFPAGPGHLFVDLLYTQGLTNLTRNDTEPTAPEDPERFKGTGMALRIAWVVTP